MKNVIVDLQDTSEYPNNGFDHHIQIHYELIVDQSWRCSAENGGMAAIDVELEMGGWDIRKNRGFPVIRKIFTCLKMAHLKILHLLGSLENHDLQDKPEHPKKSPAHIDAQIWSHINAQSAF